MENRESSYYRRDGASRPPQQEGAASQRESAPFYRAAARQRAPHAELGRPAPQYTETETANRRSARPCRRTGENSAARRAVYAAEPPGTGVCGL